MKTHVKKTITLEMSEKEAKVLLESVKIRANIEAPDNVNELSLELLKDLCLVLDEQSYYKSFILEIACH